MSFLPILIVLTQGLIGLAQAEQDFKGAEALMQIQRVLDLSAEIAKAEEVTVSDVSTSESKLTKKRQYAVPEDLLRLVDNTITDLKSHQASTSTTAAESSSVSDATYVTPTPDIRVQSEDAGNYAIVPYSSQQQREEQQHSSSNQAEPSQQFSLQSPIQYALAQDQSLQYGLSQDELHKYALQSNQPYQQQVQAQQYALQPSQQYSLEPNQGQQYSVQFTIQPEQAQQYSLQPQQAQHYAPAQSYHPPPQYTIPQAPQYQQPAVTYSQVPVGPGYVAAFTAHPTSASPPLAEVTQVVTPQAQTYPTLQTLAAYQADPHHHYTIAAHQAQTEGQHKSQHQMFYLGGHQQTGTYTEAVIRGGSPTAQYPQKPSSQLTVPKAPVQINIHPQAYSLFNYRNSQLGGQSSYTPLQILINHLAEPSKYAKPGISAPGGPDQPKMPIYHYSPVPVGTIKDEHVPEMRIKSTHTPPNPHSDKYKDYPSSSPVASSLAMPPASSFAAMSQTSPESGALPQQPVKASQPIGSSQPDWGDEEFIKYDFGYRVSDEHHKVEFGKTESKKDGVTKGSYHVLLPDGRLQIVKYWSDHTGYHTDISYKVPGVDGKKK